MKRLFFAAKGNSPIRFILGAADPLIWDSLWSKKVAAWCGHHNIAPNVTAKMLEKNSILVIRTTMVTERHMADTSLKPIGKLSNFVVKAFANADGALGYPFWDRTFADPTFAVPAYKELQHQ